MQKQKCERVGCTNYADVLVQNTETHIRFPACDSCAEEVAEEHDTMEIKDP
jgi:hypothetical protein